LYLAFTYDLKIFPIERNASAVERSENVRLLEKSFDQKDRENLSQNAPFKELVSKHSKWLHDFEYLVEMGGFLLRQREELKKP
jgi:hypothetical protein